MRRAILLALPLMIFAGCGMSKKQWQSKVAEDRAAYLAQWGDEIPEHVKTNILEGKICKGMTRNQVMLAWPHEVKYDGYYWAEPYRHSSGMSALELRWWDYYYDFGHTLYTLYFDEKGELTDWFKWEDR